MPSGLFRKEGDRWVINLPNPPASANEYHNDHARLLVRYMFLLTPDEQRRLLATAPVAPPAGPASAQKAANHVRARRRVTSYNHAIGSKSLAWNSAARKNSRVPGM
jgi:hypothetical protein